MDEENYKLILDKIDEVNGRLDKQDKKINDVCSFNQTLLNRSADIDEGTGVSDERKETLRKKIMGGIRA